MIKTVFTGKGKDFLVFLKIMRKWLTLSFGSTHHFINTNQAYGAARVEKQDLIKEAV